MSTLDTFVSSFYIWLSKGKLFSRFHWVQHLLSTAASWVNGLRTDQLTAQPALWRAGWGLPWSRTFRQMSSVQAVLKGVRVITLEQIPLTDCLESWGGMLLTWALTATPLGSVGHSCCVRSRVQDQKLLRLDCQTLCSWGIGDGGVWGGGNGWGVQKILLTLVTAQLPPSHNAHALENGD